MNRDKVLASEYHLVADDSWLLSKYMQLSTSAIERRNHRIEAANEGKTYID